MRENIILQKNRFLLIKNIFNLSLRNIIRNKSRSTVLATGLVLSITILAGTFSYVDSSSSQLISRSMDDLPVDMSMNFLNRSATIENVTEVLDAIDEIKETDIFESIDPIIGSFPFNLNFRFGFAISSDEQYELNVYHPNATGKYTPAFAFGLTADYLIRRNSPFTVTEDTSINTIGKNDILVSKTMADNNNWKIGDTVNVSYAFGETTPNLTVVMGGSMNLTISGFVDVDLGMLIGNLKAYIPEIDLDDDLVSLISFQSISADMFFLSWENMIELTQKHSFMRFIHGMHMSLDTSKLGSEVNEVEAQLLTVESVIASQFPDLIVTNFAYEELIKIEDRLLGFRLFILYFSLPGIILGFLFTLYVNNLTLDERKKEIGLFRLRNTHISVIQYIVGLEVFIISIMGTAIGFAIGAILGYILSKINQLSFQDISALSINEMIDNLSKDSLVSSIFIGILLSTTLTILFIQKISKLKLHEEIRRANTKDTPIWKKYYIDIQILLLVQLIQLMTYIGFNPIPSFAQALYDLIVPLFSWIGSTLISLRIIIWLLYKYQYRIEKLFRFIYGTPGIAIGKSLVRNRNRLNSPILVLLLSLSLIFTVANITSTFNNQADLEAKYAVGSDIRIQFPAIDQLDYKTSDFKDEILKIPGIYATEIFITLFDFGNQPSLAILINPLEFLNVSYFRDDFFYYDLPNNSLGQLDQLGMILSFNLGFPFADGYEDISKGPPTFDKNDTIPFRLKGQDYEISIIDISVRLPGLSDLVGRDSEEIPYVIMNANFFTEPLPRQSNAIAPELRNATHLFVDVDENILSISEAEKKIQKVYSEFNSSYSLGIRTIEDYSEEFFELGDLLLGLTQLEFITIAFLLVITQYLYLLSEHERREKEYAILLGMGWSSKRIQSFLSSQIVFISIFSVILALIFTPVVTFAYIPLLSSLFKFSIDDVIYSYSAMAIGTFIIILSGMITIYIGYKRTKRTNIAEVLRGV